jgi:type II secretory pathway pseudopilin PulG
MRGPMARPARSAARRRRRAAATPPDRGTTMLELSMALVLVAVLIALAMPSLLGYLDARRLSLGDTQLVSDLRGAADRARTQHVLVRLTFTVGSGSYTVETWSPLSGGDRCDPSLLPGGQGTWTMTERDALPPRLAVSAVPVIDPFVFSCLGTPDDPATGAPILPAENPLTLTIANGAGTRTVTVDLGGRVE